MRTIDFVTKECLRRKRKTARGMLFVLLAVGITLLKMLCGSSECPDAAACATGGNCGCG